MDKDLDDMPVCHQLTLDKTGRSLMSTHPVFLLSPGHPQSHADIAAVLVKQLFTGNREILYSRYRVSLDNDASAFLQLINREPAHVDPCKRGVRDSNFHPRTSAAAMTPDDTGLCPALCRAYSVAARVARSSGADTAPI